MTSQRQLAVEERREFDASSAAERAGRPIDGFINARHPEKTRMQVKYRSRLHLAGERSVALWQRVESGMPLATAVRLLREAEDAWRKGGDYPVEFDTVLGTRLKAYDSTGTVRHMNGKQWRSASPSQRASRIAKGEDRPKQAPTRVHRTNVRNAIAAWVAARLQTGGDDGRRETIVSDCMREVEMMLDGFASRLRAERPERSSFYDACDLIGIPRPRWGQRADQDRAWKNRKRALAATHPDSLGHDGGKQAFQAINDAYNTIVAYNDSLSVNGESE